MIESPIASIDPKVLGKRFQHARRARALTQEQVAKNLGYSRTTVVAIEKGERRVTESELIAFAHEYGRAISEFVRLRPETHPIVPQFRSGPSSNRSTIPIGADALTPIAEQLESLATDYLELEELCEMPLPKDYPQLYRVESSFN